MTGFWNDPSLTGRGGDHVTDGGQQTKKIFCNQCKSLTNHLLRARYSLPEEMTYELTGVEVAEDEVIGIHKKRTLLAITTRRVIKWVWTQNRDQPDAGRSKEL